MTKPSEPDLSLTMKMLNKLVEEEPVSEDLTPDNEAPEGTPEDYQPRVMLFPALADDQRTLLAPVLLGTLKKPSHLHASIAAKANAADLFILAHQQMQFILYSGSQACPLSLIQTQRVEEMLYGLEQVIEKVKTEGLPL